MTDSSTAEALALDDQLCLALYTASRAMTARYREPLSALGLTYPQYLVMMLLWEDGASSVGQIGGRLSLESSTLSPLLKRLESMGLVSRTRDTEDERSVIVGLTRSGRMLQRKASGIPAEICNATGLSLQQQGELVDQLRTLAMTLLSTRH